MYCTSKELVADFLRDQIMLGEQRSSSSTAIGMMAGRQNRPCLVPGLFRCIVDEADSLLIDEAVTPLIISNSPDGNANEPLYREARDLALQLDSGRDYTVDQHGTQSRSDRPRQRAACTSSPSYCPSDEDAGFWVGRRRREELVTQALVGEYCFLNDEQYLIDDDGKIVIIDESTGRTMADRSWRGGLHQAIEVKEDVEVTSDKENLARLSFQRFFRQYPHLAGMTGTAWEARGELWQIFNKAGRPHSDEQAAASASRCRCASSAPPTKSGRPSSIGSRSCTRDNKPVLIGTRSVWSSEEVARRLTKPQPAAPRAQRPAGQGRGRGHRTSRPAGGDHRRDQHGRPWHRHPARPRRAGQRRTERRSRRNPTSAAASTASSSAAPVARATPAPPRCSPLPRTTCSSDTSTSSAASGVPWAVVALIRIAQKRAEKLARFNRKQVLKSDDWMDQSLPF